MPFHGQIDRRDPRIIPISITITVLWCFDNNQVSNLANTETPMIIPVANINRVNRSLSMIASMMFLYCPISTSTNEPEMPGKIIAIDPMIPLKNTTIGEGVILAEGKPTNKNVIKQLKAKKNISFTPHSLTRFRIIKAEPRTKPKNRDHINNGWFSSKYLIAFDIVNIEKIIPINRGITKLNGMDFIDSLILNLKNNFKDLPVIVFIASNNSSYIPYKNAIVPLDTPGIKSARPIDKPVNTNLRLTIFLWLESFIGLVTANNYTK